MLDNNMIQAAYQRYFDRAPDQSEVDYWAGSGKSFGQISSDFVASPEYQQRAASDTSNRFIYGNTGGLGGLGGMPVLQNNPNFKEFMTPADLARVAPSNGTETGAYHPMGEAARLGTSHIANGVQLIPNAPGWNAEAAKNSGFYEQMGQSRSLMNSFGSGSQQNAGPAQNSGGLGGLGGFDLNAPTFGQGSGQFGNFGGNTSPVYRPNEPTSTPRNGWGGPWGSNNPFAPTV